MMRKKMNISYFSNDIFPEVDRCQKYGWVDIDLYFKYPEFFEDLTDFTIVIGNLSELNLEQLEHLKKDSRIKGIYIKCGYEKEHEIYSIDDFHLAAHRCKEEGQKNRHRNRQGDNLGFSVHQIVRRKDNEHQKRENQAHANDGSETEGHACQQDGKQDVPEGVFFASDEIIHTL